MQKEKRTKPIKQIIIFTILVIIVLLLTFSEDIINLSNKNRVGLLENTPSETIISEPNIPVLSAGMIPIKAKGESFVITTESDNDWYDYKLGKPAYIMLNDGTYQSELLRDMTGKKLASDAVENDALVVPNENDTMGTIFVWIPRFAYNEDGDIQYIKDIEQADENWTIPEMFTYKQASETSPDFLLTGIWLEKDVGSTYTTKINQMNQEESIYGFIKNTIAVPSDQTTGNTIQTYIQNLVGNDAHVVPSITDPTNPNRIILKIINQRNQDPIKATVSYNKNTGLITAQVTYSQYGISKITLENEHELTFTKKDGITIANTEGIELEDGINLITIVDTEENKKEFKIQVMGAIYVTLYTDGTLAFGRSVNPIPEKTISASYGEISGQVYSTYRNPTTNLYYSNTPWDSNKGNIRTVEFVNKIYPISTASWFVNCTNLTAINNIEKLDTKYVTNMVNMFNGCSSLTSLDLSGFNTSNVTSMQNMFYNCSSLSSIDLSGFYTSNVTNMNSMFYGCSSLTSLNVNNFDTSNVTDVGNLFNACSSLIQISFGENWNKQVTLPTHARPCTGWYSDIEFTNKVAEARANYTPVGLITIYAHVLSDVYVKLYTDGTLAFCSNNSQIPFKELSQDYGNITGKNYSSTTIPWVNEQENVINVNIIDEISPVSTQYWFYGCANLIGINNIEKLDTSNVTTMNSMFYGCSSLTSLNVSNFDTSNVTTMNSMVFGCSSLTSLDLSSFDTSKVTGASNIFRTCSSLIQISFGEKWNQEITLPTFERPCAGWYSDETFTNKVAKVGANYTPIGPITIYANFPADIYAKLYTDGTLALSLSDNTMAGKELSQDYGNILGNTTSTSSWKNESASITTVEFVDEIYPISTAGWFSNCKNLTTINNIENLNTNYVTNMSYMFSSCSSLTGLELSSFDTSNVTNMYGMFYNCSSLTSLNLSSFNTRNVTTMEGMFDNCRSLTSLDLNSFNTYNVTTMKNMFYRCSSLTNLNLSSFNTYNVTTMYQMFYYCSSLTSLDLSSFNTYKVTKMDMMFFGCSKLKTIYVGTSWRLATSTTNMFASCGTSTTTLKK